MGERFNLQRVLGQLRYTGILDTVRVRASGYIIRKTYQDFAPLCAHRHCNLPPAHITTPSTAAPPSLPRRLPCPTDPTARTHLCRRRYVHPCNLLPDDYGLQGSMSDLEFADKLRGDRCGHRPSPPIRDTSCRCHPLAAVPHSRLGPRRELSLAVTRALLTAPEFGVPVDEFLEGKTMIFIKKLVRDENQALPHRKDCYYVCTRRRRRRRRRRRSTGWCGAR